MFILLIVSLLVCYTNMISIMPELKRNELRFGYGVNFRYEGMLAHSFDRFYVVTKIEIPSVSDLNLTRFQFDFNCTHAENPEKGTRFKAPKIMKEKFIVYCRNIIPYMSLYKNQMDYYEKTVYKILEKDIGLILPKFESSEIPRKQERPKRQIISALISGFIGLAFEGISSFLQHKREKALHKAIQAMNKRNHIERNRVFHLEDSMIMYGIYNVDTLEKLINMVHKMNNRSIWFERLYAGHANGWFEKYAVGEGAEYYAIHSLLYLRTIQEKYVKMYERFVTQLREYSKAIRILSKGYLPISLIPPSKLAAILSEVKHILAKTNKNYGLVIRGMYKYYDMKLITFGIDEKRNLIVQFPIFVQPYTQKPLTLYQIETIPVPILDMNEEANSYTWIKIDKPYIALDSNTYITIRTEELRTCKRIGYEYYCEELFVVKSKLYYSCASALYFQLSKQTIKDNCVFEYYYNKTDVKPSVLDGGNEIILANWPSFKRMLCTTHNNIPIEIPSHPYVLLNRSVLCNCIVEAENNFLLDSIAVCDPNADDIDLTMYFTANTAFLNYFEGMIDQLQIPNLNDVTMQEHILPIYLNSSEEIDKELLMAPRTLKELVENYKKKKLNFDKQHDELDKENMDIIETVFDHSVSKMFMFVMAIISVLIVVIIIAMIFKGKKMKTLMTNLALIKGAKALNELNANNNYEYVIIIIWLSLILLGVIFLILERLNKMPIFDKYRYSNTIKIMLFISNIKSYVPVRLCKTTGSIHLFKLIGNIQRENLKLHRNRIWDILEMDWRNVTITINGNVVNLPGSVIIPFRDKFKIRRMMRKRPILFHIMLKQGRTWYPLSNVREMLEIENNVPESIEMHMEP